MFAQLQGLIAAGRPLTGFKVIGRKGERKNQAKRNVLRRAQGRVIEHLEARTLFSGGTWESGYAGTGYAYIRDFVANGITGKAIALTSDNKVLIGGTYGLTSGVQDFMLARLTTSGGLDTTFGSGGTGIVTTDFTGGGDGAASINVLSNGKIILAGTTEVTPGSGIEEIALARYNSDGSLDTTFGSGGKVVDYVGADMNVTSSVIQSDGKIVVGGTCMTSSGPDFMVARFNADGSVDTSFGTSGMATTHLPGFASIVECLALDSSGDIVAGGTLNYVVSSSAEVVRYTPSGALDTSFNGTGIETLNLGPSSTSAIIDLAIQSDGKIVLGGSNSGTADSALARLNTDGSLDTTFNSTGILDFNIGSVDRGIIAIAIQPDGKILAESANYDRLARVTSSGAIDTGFGSSGIASDTGNTFESAGLAIENDGKVVVAGFQSNGYFAERFTDTALPTANAGGPYSVNTQSSVGLSASSSSDPDGESLSFQWDTSYNGITFNPTLTGQNPTFSAVGISGTTTRTIAVKATDLLGAGSVLATTTITINKVAPTVTPSASPTTVNEGTAVPVTATVSDVDPTDTYTYDWHVTDNTGQVFSDGTTLNWSFTPASTGTYTATLTVTDAFGSVVSNGVTITSQHVAPTVSISGPANASRAANYTLNLAAAEHGYETINSWTINWGDGTIQTYSGNPTSETHLYVTAGATTISASVTDAYGTFSASAPVSMTVANGLYYDLGAANPVAYASAGANAGYVVDGNSSTEWNSGNVSANPNQWLFIDLGASYNINEVKLNWDSNYANTYKVRISNDSCTWVDLTGVQFGTSGINDMTGLNGNARYVLISMTSLATSQNSYALKDFQVYGSADLATNRIIWASSNGLAQGNANDTSNATEWTSTATINQWLFVDLGDVYNINSAKINFDGDYPVQYSICASCDTVNWTQISPTYTGSAGWNSISGFNGDARYVMLAMPNPANGVDVKVSDFEVGGGSVLSLNRPVTVSSGSTTATNAVDGNTSTSWTSSTTGTQSIYTDLGAAYDITRVTLNWGTTNYPSNFQLQVSSDASNWLTVYSYGAYGGGILDQGSIYNTGRYVRVLCTAGSGSNYSLKEFSVYGSADLALNRIFSSSTNVSGHEAGYAADMDPTTYWQSTGLGTQTLTVDLGAVFTITTVTAYWDAAYSNNYTISVSNDNVNWTSIASVNYAHQGQVMTAGLFSTGRYVRLTMTSGVGSYYRLNDLAVFGH